VESSKICLSLSNSGEHRWRCRSHHVHSRGDHGGGGGPKDLSTGVGKARVASCCRSDGGQEGHIGPETPFPEQRTESCLIHSVRFSREILASCFWMGRAGIKHASCMCRQPSACCRCHLIARNSIRWKAYGITFVKTISPTERWPAWRRWRTSCAMPFAILSFTPTSSGQ